LKGNGFLPDFSNFPEALKSFCDLLKNIFINLFSEISCRVEIFSKSLGLISVGIKPYTKPNFETRKQRNIGDL